VSQLVQPRYGVESLTAGVGLGLGGLGDCEAHKQARHVMWCSNLVWRQPAVWYTMECNRGKIVCARTCVRCCAAVMKPCLSNMCEPTSSAPVMLLTDTTAGKSTRGMLTGLGEGLGGLGEGLGEGLGGLGEGLGEGLGGLGEGLGEGLGGLGEGLGEGLGGLGEGLGERLSGLGDCSVHRADMTSRGRRTLDMNMLCEHNPARACNNHGIQNHTPKLSCHTRKLLTKTKLVAMRCRLAFPVFGEPCHTKPYNAIGNSTVRSPDWRVWGLGTQPTELYKHRQAGTIRQWT